MHAGLRQQARDAHEGPAVFLVGRRVHGDEAAAVFQRGAEIAPEACILGSRRQLEARAAQFGREPALQASAPIIAVYH